MKSSNAEERTSNNQDVILEIEQLEKSFGSQKVLNGISFKVSRGEVVAIIGPSGSGKSTLLRCINYLEKPDSGRIHMNGKIVGQKEIKGRLVRERESTILKYRAEVGMVFQQFNLFPHMTSLENIVEAPMAVRGIPKQQARNTAIELLHKVHLFEKENSYPHQMSGGEQQRVAIARALIMKPKVLLFDEVTSALDPETVGEVLKVMMELAEEGMTMLIVSHEMGFVREAADRVLFLSDGKILEQGSPQELLVNPKSSVAQRFLRRLK